MERKENKLGKKNLKAQELNPLKETSSSGGHHISQSTSSPASVFCDPHYIEGKKTHPSNKGKITEMHLNVPLHSLRTALLVATQYYIAA